MRNKVLEVWVDENKTILRDLTEEETLIYEQDQKEYEEFLLEEARSNQLKEEAIAHAKSLGFTDEMIKIMYPGL